ncbi:MAG: Gfo/Idh/MocA family oxidoreductase, partial [candidate division KSB1 bacterium]|nr:Gfo/Idh/MocA family oxidoreductase [candidate division KSB1 bacterium]
MSEKFMNRREFIGTTAAAAAAVIVPRHVLGGPGFVAPSDKIQIGLIGCGTQALRMIWDYLRNDNIQMTAVCDCNRNSQDYPEWGRFDLRNTIRRELDEPRFGEGDTGCRCGREIGKYVVDTFYRKKRGLAAWQGCSSWEDFRDMLANEKHLDAVWIMTPDHTHGVIAYKAMQAGKHVILHKPLSNVIAETRLMTQLAEEKGLATQMYCAADNQMRPLIKEWIQAGVIGAVREVHNWSRRPVWPQGMDAPKEKVKPPKGFNWDLWLGPAEERPYHPTYTHTYFRGWYDFGSGPLGDMGHYSGYQIWDILDLHLPLSVEASASEFCRINETGQAEKVVNRVSFPQASIVHWEFPARGEQPPVDFYWYDGGIRPHLWKEMEIDGREMPDEGLLFVGDKGKLLCEFSGESPRLIPNKAMSEFVRPPKTLPRPIDELDQFIRACRGEKPSDARFQVVQPITETLLLGTIALRVRGKLYWDAEAMRFTNSD